MKLIKPDHDRRIEIPGVPGPVSRPVDVDQLQTGFANLRTLRIYRFDAESEIDGHAEEDEVFVIVLAGSIELTISGAATGEDLGPVSLSSPGDPQSNACVAYLPPHSAYRLVAQTDADVAYARATPVGGQPPAIFSSQSSGLNENAYALRLRLRLTTIDATGDDVTLTPVTGSEAALEALVHLRAEPAEHAAVIMMTNESPLALDSWDTVTISPGDRAVLRIARGTSALVLTVLAV